MKNSWKLFFGFLLVGALSAGIGAVTFSVLQSRNGGASGDQVFSQNCFKSVNYAPPAENTDFTYAAEQTVHAVVHIKSVAKQTKSAQSDPRYFDPFEFFFGRTPDMQQQPRVGFGSGVIISNDGYIITNNHVIEGADELEVTTNDSQVYKAKVIGGDDVSDIALIKIEGTDFPVIPFGDSDKLKVGEWVLAVGNPFNLNSTVTAGIVSAKGRGNVFPRYDRSRSAEAQMKVESFIQTDAAVNPGNSGGALVNTKGELVGINTAIYSETGSYAGYSFAVPASIAKKVASDLKQYGVVQRAVLGVQIGNISALKQADPDAAAKVSVAEGAYVGGFSSGSAAKSAGIEIGDVITYVNDAKIKAPSELQEQISRYNPGEKVKVTVQRGKTEKVFNVELKNMQGSTDIVKNTTPADLLGATFKELSSEKKKELGVDFGIEVAGLSNGKLKEAGVPSGFIILTANDRRINSVDEFEKIVQTIAKQNADDRGLFLKGVSSKGKVGYYAIDLNE